MLRHDILDLLNEQPSENVSGEKISRQLKVTRAAIWKQIKILKEEGFEIEAQPKNGYRLLKTPLALNEWVLRRTLDTRSLGYAIEVHEDLSSTNERAKELARQGAPHGQVVLAKRQSSGKGRLQRQWESPLGGLWMSAVLRPNLSLADATKITLAASVAVVDALKELVDRPFGIKWPNDIVFEGRKIAGILGEVVGEWNVVQTLILGIGVNVNFSWQGLGDPFSAITLYELLGDEVDLNRLAAGILRHLENELMALEHKEFARLRLRWSERAVGLGKEVRVLRGEQVSEGIFKGISIDGSLLLETGDGEKSFSAGEVRLRSKQGVYF